MEVHLHTNSSCNLHCLHCYNRSVPSGEGAYLINGELSGLLQILCDDFNAEIHLEGGEIFLYPEAIRILGTLNPKFLNNITLTTNGTIFVGDSDVLEVLRMLGNFRVSVEGHTNEQNMQLRGIGLGGIIRNALRYQSEGVPVCLRITLTSRNYGGMVDETLPYFMSLGFKNMQVYEFQSIGRGRESSSDFALGESLQEFFTLLVRHGKYSGASVKIMLPARRIAETETYKDSLEAAGIGVEFLPKEEGISINPDGDVFLCAWDDNKNNALFNFRREGLAKMPGLLRNLELTHHCENCSALRLTA
ncbi:MAG: radical SAM protein [Synergistaceae bacterium]|nr:radical SAM protein [Synergistaceae bacterium]